jgi:outer membrane autotransporter protein
MKSTMKSLTIATFSALSIASVLNFAKPAAADERTGLDGSYLGSGLSIGLSQGGQADQGREIGGNVQGRIDIPNVPISLRGSALFTDQNAAFVPMISYDLAVGHNTNVYVGGGASLLLNDDGNTPLGDRNAFAATLGVESAMTDRIAVYSDVKLGINAFEKNTADAVSLQVGAAYRF